MRVCVFVFSGAPGHVENSTLSPTDLEMLLTVSRLRAMRGSVPDVFSRMQTAADSWVHERDTAEA